ncbi:MAG: type II CRISPR-associated endonuclease Cas1 [Lentisphaeria bacterium]
MSHHMLHILTAGAVLRKQRGNVVFECRASNTRRQLPLEDIRAIIIAARGVTLTPDLLRELMDHNTIVLHCDHSFKPVGVTASLNRTVNRDALLNQVNTNLKLHERLWKRVLTTKISNQAGLLKGLGFENAFLTRQLHNSTLDEASAARFYWQGFFAALGVSGTRRRRDLDSPPNACLNYGYAVAQALVHRSIIAHGLTPAIGLHHVTRYDADPMVYDLMEPVRPFVDGMLADYVFQGHSMAEKAADMRDWCRHVATNLMGVDVPHKRGPKKLIDAIDHYVSCIEQCFRAKSVKNYWGPKLKL